MPAVYEPLVGRGPLSPPRGAGWEPVHIGTFAARICRAK